MVVELYIVPVNEVAHCFMDGDIASVGVARRSNEVRGLGGVGEVVLAYREDSTNSFCAVYEPLLSGACLHGCVVFPVEVDSIQVVVSHILCHYGASGDWIFPLSSRVVSGSECRDHDCDSGVVVVLSQ